MSSDQINSRHRFASDRTLSGQARTICWVFQALLNHWHQQLRDGKARIALL